MRVKSFISGMLVFLAIVAFVSVALFAVWNILVPCCKMSLIQSFLISYLAVVAYFTFARNKVKRRE